MSKQAKKKKIQSVVAKLEIENERKETRGYERKKKIEAKRMS